MKLHIFQIPVYPPKNNRNMALQVHNRLHPFLPLSGRAAPGDRPLRASLTLEAALVLPLFLFMMYLLILPMRMMDSARAMQQLCEAVCQDTAEACYLLQAENSSDASDQTAGATDSADSDSADIRAREQHTAGARSGRSSALHRSAAALAALRASTEIEDAFIENIRSHRSSCLSDGETITIVLDYDYHLPFSVFGLSSIPQTVTASRRAWIGRNPAGQSSDSNNTEGTLVYIGKSSTRYHSSAGCHYLSNELRAVPYHAIASERNSGGSRYHACPRCAKGVSAGTVYIMPSGSAYHANTDCSAIRAYAQLVPKSSVEHLGPCSYCCP
ncbi:hypothetical protein EI53_01979 [Fusobacterium naviforme]|uniref:TadE-like protein n=1 Tax=Moryella indoligenes TaxID=371674 RepID=A0AAE3V957_9FIRM|nr:hypothetical protein [Moryella indoligenes]KAB0576199.1 hypothetical protein F7P78_10060 [Fusobacterium naviforme]MDQ0151595.1 hypothetical protein [Moryella indoligenes]PSL09002.1 hypothetical protein EI53_01979 [Fusobacterium naviforme]STO28209.1 Uncharacterised protein [Fusobacterium naviforme]